MNWISVKDRLPKDHERVLVRLGDGGFVTKKDRMEIAIARFSGGEFYIYLTYRDGMMNDLFIVPCFVDRVTHWMPLPEPPEDGV